MPGRGRGRGRGRGGRGRGGRGRSGSRRGGGSSSWRSTSEHNTENTEEAKIEEMDIDKDVKSFFRGTVGFDHHYEAQTQNRERYLSGMATLFTTDIQIPQNTRVRALAAAWARHDHELADALLRMKSSFGLVEVLKALTLLDSSRRISALEKRERRLTLSNNKVSPHKLAKLKMEIKNLESIKPKHGSASGAVCRHVRRWVQRFSGSDLEYYALHYPKEPWKKLSDICHLNPQQDFSELPWFLPFCFGQPAPEDSMVNKCEIVTAENVNNLVSEFPVPFSHLKQFKDNLTLPSKARIAEYTEKLDHVLWNYEDLQCPETDEVIASRLAGGEQVTLANGKLLERLLTFKMIRENIPARFAHLRKKNKKKAVSAPTKVSFLKDLIPIAEKRVKNISLELDSPVVIMGDASGSMEVAIRTSTIIAGLLTSITSAKLVFFNTETRESPFLPETVEQVLDLAVSTEASGGTTPAASLYPFYRDKEVVKTFIVVTDEEENGQCEGYSFDRLFKAYHEEVYPAKLVFVSFVRNQHSVGQMVSKLAEFNPLQFKLDSSRPDLTKLDTLFGLLSMESQNFEDQLDKLVKDMKSRGIQKSFGDLVLDNSDPSQI